MEKTSINSRLKFLRKETLGLSQKEFGEKIGLKNGAISWLEKPGNTVVDQNIRLICEKFRVNEAWLRTGEGDIFRQDGDYILDKLADTYQLTGKRRDMLRAYLSLSDEQQEAIVDSVCALARSINAPADTAADTGSKSTDEAARLHAQLDAELQAERGDVSASSATSSEKRA